MASIAPGSMEALSKRCTRLMGERFDGPLFAACAVNGSKGPRNPRITQSLQPADLFHVLHSPSATPSHPFPR